MSNQSTPKTLYGAILNGLGASLDHTPQNMEKLILSHAVRIHVRDYIASKFAVAYLMGDAAQESDLKALFDAIVKDEGLKDE